MITLQVTVDVKDDRRVVLTLPPEVPVGPAEMVVTISQEAGRKSYRVPVSRSGRKPMANIWVIGSARKTWKGSPADARTSRSTWRRYSMPPRRRTIGWGSDQGSKTSQARRGSPGMFVD
jgi:hypothetical protein